MKFLVYEHTLAETGDKDFSHIICEGYAMLNGVAADLKSLNHHVTVILSKHFRNYSTYLSSDRIVFVSSFEEREKIVNKILSEVDAAVAVAPETGGLLYDIVKKIEKKGCLFLNCPSDTLRKFTRKSTIYEVLAREDVSIPKILKASFNEKASTISEKVRSVGYPAIIKPEDGVGCSGISLIEDQSQIPTALNKVKKDTSFEEFIIQEYIEGTHASLSILCNHSDKIILSLNGQWINLQSSYSESQYLGGFIPLKSKRKIKDLAYKTAEKTVKALDPLKGYVGVDVILTGKKVYVVDVNPRFTTSYIGLRKTLKSNTLGILLRMIEKQEIPRRIDMEGYCFFAKTGNTQIENVEYASPKIGPYNIVLVHEPTLKMIKRRFKLLSKKVFGQHIVYPA